jgi:hypothetical protein
VLLSDEHLFHMTPVLQLTALLTTFICTDDDLVTLTVDEVAGVQVRRLRFREGQFWKVFD